MNKAKFIVGKWYDAYDHTFPSIKVLKRTPKMIEVENEITLIKYRMKIHLDADGNEYAVDSSVPKRWREAFTYNSKWGSKKNDTDTRS